MVYCYNEYVSYLPFASGVRLWPMHVYCFLWNQYKSPTCASRRKIIGNKLEPGLGDRQIALCNGHLACLDVNEQRHAVVYMPRLRRNYLHRSNWLLDALILYEAVLQGIAQMPSLDYTSPLSTRTSWKENVRRFFHLCPYLRLVFVFKLTSVDFWRSVTSS